MSDWNEFQLWDMATGEPLAPPVTISEATTRNTAASPAIRPDNKAILVPTRNSAGKIEVQYLDTTSGQPLGPPIEIEQSLSDLTFGPDGKTVLIAEGKTVRILNLPSGRPIGPPIVTRNGNALLALSPDGRTVVAGEYGGDPGSGTRRRASPSGDL